MIKIFRCCCLGCPVYEKWVASFQLFGDTPCNSFFSSCRSPDNGSSSSGGHGDSRSPQILAKAVQVHPDILKGMYFA